MVAKNEYGIDWLDDKPFILSLWRLREAGHALYQGERCQLSGDPDHCDACALLIRHIG
jgi:hypothetical protein